MGARARKDLHRLLYADALRARTLRGAERFERSEQVAQQIERVGARVEQDAAGAAAVREVEYRVEFGRDHDDLAEEAEAQDVPGALYVSGVAKLRGHQQRRAGRLRRLEHRRCRRAVECEGPVAQNVDSGAGSGCGKCCMRRDGRAQDERVRSTLVDQSIARAVPRNIQGVRERLTARSVCIGDADQLGAAGGRDRMSIRTRSRTRPDDAEAHAGFHEGTLALQCGARAEGAAAHRLRFIGSSRG